MLSAGHDRMVMQAAHVGDARPLQRPVQDRHARIPGEDRRAVAHVDERIAEGQQHNAIAVFSLERSPCRHVAGQQPRLFRPARNRQRLGAQRAERLARRTPSSHRPTPRALPAWRGHGAGETAPPLSPRPPPRRLRRRGPADRRDAEARTCTSRNRGGHRRERGGRRLERSRSTRAPTRSSPASGCEMDLRISELGSGPSSSRRHTCAATPRACRLADAFALEVGGGVLLIARQVQPERKRHLGREGRGPRAWRAPRAHRRAAHHRWPRDRSPRARRPACAREWTGRRRSRHAVGSQPAWRTQASIVFGAVEGVSPWRRSHQARRRASGSGGRREIAI